MECWVLRSGSGVKEGSEVFVGAEEAFAFQGLAALLRWLRLFGAILRHADGGSVHFWVQNSPPIRANM